MKRAVLGGLLVIAAVLGSPAIGQDQVSPRMSFGTGFPRGREEKERVAPAAEYLIYQRARHEADQRAARLEMYRWMGHSPQRPVVRHDPFSTELNPGLNGWGYHPGVWNVRW